MRGSSMKICNDNLPPQAPDQELSAGERRALKRQLDSFISDLARDLLGERHSEDASRGNLKR